jgi:hypothetical protein
MELKHGFCSGCRVVSLSQKVDKNGYCDSCKRRSDKDFLMNNRLLPLWYIDDVPQFKVPEVLSDLTHAEKMLIQRVSPVVPLHHIKNGVFGLSGHVCAFEQNISTMASILPRLPTDTAVLKVLQVVKSEIGGNETMVRTFKVRKQKVIDALIFLKTYSKEYNDIIIDESRLMWMSGDEDDLDAHTINVPVLKTRADDNHSNSDMGPSSKQCVDPQRMGDDIHAFGYIEDDGPSVLSANDMVINNELQHEISQSPSKHLDEMDWPEIADMPVSEYGDTRIFARAFPWLFPGGYGDIKDYDNADENLASWGRRLLYYEDGRFAKDKLFCFFALNYIVRRRNSKSGQFFIDSFQKNVPETLDELKQSIRSGDMQFVNHLTYWNKRIKGSNPYWFQKRAEVYAWVNEHIQLGNGAPTFFITLSCAEYFWPDVVRLLKDRFELAGLDTSDIYEGSPRLIQLVNDYTIVIQEYFQKRTEIWLETIGKAIFGIKHHWARYEFAPGRGQIHTHLLAIPEDHDVFEECYHLLKEDNGDIKRAEHLADWASKQFGLTACVDDGFDAKVSTDTINSIKLRFSDIGDDDDQVRNDIQDLLHTSSQHQCSDFCMKKGHEERYGYPTGCVCAILVGFY